MTDFEKLFNENREFIFKYLMKMTRDITLSEELTQETFFRAYMNYASLKNKGKAYNILSRKEQSHANTQADKTSEAIVPRYQLNGAWNNYKEAPPSIKENIYVGYLQSV